MFFEFDGVVAAHQLARCDGGAVLRLDGHPHVGVAREVADRVGHRPLLEFEIFPAVGLHVVALGHADGLDALFDACGLEVEYPRVVADGENQSRQPAELPRPGAHGHLGCVPRLVASAAEGAACPTAGVAEDGPLALLKLPVDCGQRLAVEQVVHANLVGVGQPARCLVAEEFVAYAAVEAPEVGHYLLGRRDADERVGLPGLVGVELRPAASHLEQQEVLHRVFVFGPLLVVHAVADDESRCVEHLAG